MGLQPAHCSQPVKYNQSSLSIGVSERHSDSSAKGSKLISIACVIATDIFLSSSEGKQKCPFDKAC